MSSKQALQTLLRERYGINKNISQALSAEDCEQLLELLQAQPSLVKLVESFALKNSDLGKNNQHFGRLRTLAEKKLQTLQQDYEQLEAQVTSMEQAKQLLEDRKLTITRETAALEAQIKRLSSEKLLLNSKVSRLTSQNDELTEANAQLKKDNKDLKNTVDKIRLRLAQNIQELLQYENNELRRALIRLFRWTLG